eukprot:610950-Hanusia_phi.AAC.1
MRGSCPYATLPYKVATEGRSCRCHGAPCALAHLAELETLFAAQSCPDTPSSASCAMMYDQNHRVRLLQSHQCSLPKRYRLVLG